MVVDLQEVAVSRCGSDGSRSCTSRSVVLLAVVVAVVAVEAVVAAVGGYYWYHFDSLD